MRALTILFLVVMCVGSMLLAQGRQPLVGTVVDADGKPVAGAAVTLVEDDVDLVGLECCWRVMAPA